jgi:hypothetical protein
MSAKPSVARFTQRVTPRGGYRGSRMTAPHPTGPSPAPEVSRDRTGGDQMLGHSAANGVPRRPRLVDPAGGGIVGEDPSGAPYLTTSMSSYSCAHHGGSRRAIVGDADHLPSHHSHRPAKSTRKRTPPGPPRRWCLANETTVSQQRRSGERCAGSPTAPLTCWTSSMPREARVSRTMRQRL